MTKHDLLRRVTHQTGLDLSISQEVIEGFFDVVKESLAKGKTIYVRQFGSFAPKQRAEKKARNIKKNILLTIPAHMYPVFKPSDVFRDQVRKRNAVEPKK